MTSDTFLLPPWVLYQHLFANYMQVRLPVWFILATHFLDIAAMKPQRQTSTSTDIDKMDMTIPGETIQKKRRIALRMKQSKFRLPNTTRLKHWSKFHLVFIVWVSNLWHVHHLFQLLLEVLSVVSRIKHFLFSRGQDTENLTKPHCNRSTILFAIEHIGHDPLHSLSSLQEKKSIFSEFLKPTRSPWKTSSYIRPFRNSDLKYNELWNIPNSFLNSSWNNKPHRCSDIFWR